MERKVGEIFEYNGEWYQCIHAPQKHSYKLCDLRGLCCDNNGVKIVTCAWRHRKDNTSVIFKKLEKIGEPTMLDGKLVQKILTTDGYSCNGCCFKSPECDKADDDLCCKYEIYVEIKQNKENMEEETKLPKEDNALTRTVHDYVNGKISDKELIKSIKEMSDEYPYIKDNLKPFDLEAAKAGKPVCTRDGRKARIICFDAKRKDGKNIMALIPSKEYPEFEDLVAYPNNGNYHGGHENDGDLMMLHQKKEGWINLCKNNHGDTSVVGVFPNREEAVSNCPPTYLSTIKIECDIVAMKESFAEAFNDGANWRINSVWHEVSEEPERNRIYLAQLGDCAFDTFYDSENWVKFSRGVNMQRWAYVEDLLPNK